MMVAMNSARKNFLLFRWRDIAAVTHPALVSNGGETGTQ
jgi:hypothetical protein